MISLHIDVLASEGTKKLHLSPEVIEIPNFVRQLIYAPFLRFDQFNLFRDLFFEDLRIPGLQRDTSLLHARPPRFWPRQKHGQDGSRSRLPPKYAMWHLNGFRGAQIEFRPAK